MNGFRQNVQLDPAPMLQKAWDAFQRDLVNWVLIAVVGTFALGVGAWGGWHHCALKALHGEHVTVEDVLYPFHRLSLVVPAIVVLFVSLFTLGLGGLVLAFLWFWLYPLMLERNLSFGEAATVSKDAALANAGPTLLAVIVVAVLGSLGGAVAVGMFLTTPIAALFSVLAYKEIFADGPTPQDLDHAPRAQASDWGAAPGPDSSARQASTAPPGPPPGGDPHGGFAAPQARPEPFAPPGPALAPSEGDPYEPR